MEPPVVQLTWPHCAQGSDEGMSPAGAGVDVDGPASCCTATFFFSALDLPTTSGRPICACGTDCAVNKRTAAWACECAMHWSKARYSAWHARTGREHDLHGVGCTATASAAALGHSKRPSLAPTARGVRQTGPSPVKVSMYYISRGDVELGQSNHMAAEPTHRA